MHFCVIIPAKNEEKVLSQTLGSLLWAGVHPKNIYICDDGSFDRTGDIAQGFTSNVLRNTSSKGKARSITELVRHFKLTQNYEFLFVLDADSTPHKFFFEKIIQALNDNPDAVMACGTVKSRPKNWLTAWRALQYAACHWLYKDAQNTLGVITVSAGCATAFRCSDFNKIWSDEPSRVEDMMATLRAHYLDKKILYVKDAILTTADPSDLRSYVRQGVRWNSGAWECSRRFKIWGKKKKIALELQFLLAEGLFGSLFLFLWPLWFYLFPRAAKIGLGMDIGFLLLSTIIVSISQHRPDILVSFPSFILMRFIDAGIFMISFFRGLFIGKIRGESWISALRY